jgi:hypothetical protein
MPRKLLVLVSVAAIVGGCALIRSGTDRESLMPEGQYLVVNSVEDGTEADRVGLKEGDIILSYDGKEVTSVAQLNELKMKVKTDEVDLVVLRKDEKREFKIKAGQIGVYLSERRPEIELAEDAVVLKGVGKLGWDTGMSSSFIAALAVTADYLGMEKDYTYLMGVSGGAFRIHFHKDWCPSSPDATVGLDTGGEALKALGLGYEYHHLAGSVAPFGETEEVLTKAIMKSIDDGRPVLAIDLIEVPEWGVITGYQNGGSELLCRTYFDKQEGYSIAEKFPWVIVILTEENKPPSDEENYRNALKVALEVATTESFGDYYSGTAALEKWIERMNMDNFMAMKPDTFENCMLSNAWIYSRLHDDRTYASRFLDDLAGQFPEHRVPLLSLSTIYMEQVEILEGAAKNAPFPYAIQQGDTWTGDMRGEEVKALKAVLEKEREAVKLLEQIDAKM